MNRIDRISAILIQLQSHSLVKAQQISERFNISIHCISRYKNIGRGRHSYHREIPVLVIHLQKDSNYLL